MLFFDIVSVSFAGICAYDKVKNDFDSWVKVKKNLNYELNKIVISYIAQKVNAEKYISCDKMYRQFNLDLIAEIIETHYHDRLRIYRFACKFKYGERKVFIAISLIDIYINCFLRFLQSLKKLGLRYDSPVNNGYKRFIVTVNFPDHSFSVPEYAENLLITKKPFSSLGEFLLEYSHENGEVAVLSLDEYVRKSKNKEALIEVDSVDKRINIVDRQILKQKKNLSNIVSDTFLIMPLITKSILLNHSFLSYIFRILYICKYIDSIRYESLLTNLKNKGCKVDHILLPSFHTLGVIKYDDRHGVIMYNYAENFFIPPISEIRKINNSFVDIDVLLSEISLSSLMISSDVIGFTDVAYLLNSAKKIISENCGCPLPVMEINKIEQRTAVLGYEVDVPIIKIDGYKDIAVFDVPPEEKITQLSRSLVGDLMASFDGIEKFWLDIISVVCQYNFRVLFKPKYSFENYSVEYKELIDKIKNKLKEKFIVLSPYHRMGSILINADICLCLPYTSVHKIALEYGKTSYYYVPEMYRIGYESEYDIENTIVGKIELNKMLKYYMNNTNEGE